MTKTWEGVALQQHVREPVKVPSPAPTPPLILPVVPEVPVPSPATSVPVYNFYLGITK